MAIRTLKINEWIYEGGIENDTLKFNVKSPDIDKFPETLFKLYPPNERGVEAVTKNYLFGSHPKHFNDLFDCHRGLVKTDDVSMDEFILEYLTEMIGKQEIKKLSNEEIKERIIELRSELSYITFGIICMTSDPQNVLMWAYYGNNTGFMVEYEYEKLPSNFLGPFPINYQKSVEAISHAENGPQIAALYQSTIKSQVWEHESEWRFLARCPEGRPLLPYGIHEDPKNKTHNRKFTYDQNVVKSISFGNRFFHTSEINVAKDDILYVKLNASPDPRTALLDYLVEKNIPTHYALQQNDLMTIKFRKTKIKKIRNNEYAFE